MTTWIVHGHREKIDIRTRRLGTNSGTQNNSFAIGNHNGTVSLTRDLTGFQNQFGVAPLHFLADDIKHYFLFLFQTFSGPG